MKLWQIAIRNMRRRLGKTALLVAGLTVGVAMAVALTATTIAMRSDIERKLDEYGANIIVLPRSENLSLSYGGVSVTDASYDVAALSDADAARIGGIHLKKNVSAIAPKLIGAHKDAEGRTLLIVGVDFPVEFKLKKWWRIEGMAHEPVIPESPAKGPGDIVLGHGAAAVLGKRTGDTLALGPKTYKVAAVLEENASQDDSAVFMDLREAQGLLGRKGSLSMIEVSALCSNCPIEDIVNEISALLPHAKVSPVRQAMTLRMDTVEQLERFSFAVSVVVLMIAALIVFISMLSSVNERTREIGVLRAIGYRQGHIIRIVLTEALAVSVFSGLAGWMIGALAASTLMPRLIASAGSSSAAAMNPAILSAAMAVSIIIGLLGSLYPARKAARLDPLDALRSL